MSKGIFSRLDRWFIDRMREWAMETLRPAGSTVPSSWPSRGVVQGDGLSFQSRNPTLLGRVHDTEAALDELPIRYRQAVRQFWLYEGQSLRWHGRHRGINHETFELWVIKGHNALAEIFGRQHENWKRRHHEREKVLTLAAPPKYDSQQ